MKFKPEHIDIVFSHAVDLHNRRLYLVHGDDDSPGVVGPSLAALALQGIRTLDDTEGEIEVFLNSMGGDEYAMLAIYDILKSAKNRVIIKVYGCAMSAGVFILQAGDRRLLSPNSTLMAHFGTTSLSTTSPNLPRMAAETERLSTIYRDVLLEKIRAKKQAMTARKLSKLLVTDWYLSAYDAVDWGLADGILGA